MHFRVPIVSAALVACAALLSPSAALALWCSVGQVQNCLLANGCGGTQTCLMGKGGNYWSACTCSGIGATPGAACDSLCDGLKGSLVCNATCSEPIGCGTTACTTCGEKGARGTVVCPLKGGMLKCVAAEVCNNCDDDTDGMVDNAPGQAANTLTQACNPSSCTYGGTQVCTKGTWGVCTGCSGTGTCSVCGGKSTFTCSANACTAPVCTRAEECNKCDDDGDGVIDNGLYCAKCSGL